MKAGIVGAGILGRLLAFHLQQLGWTINLFDQDDYSGKKSCSYVAAGLLTPVSELDRANEIIYHLGLESLQLWPKIINAFSSNIYFQHNGTLLLSSPHDHAQMTDFLRRTFKPNNVMALTSVDIQELEPEICKFSKGYYFANEAHIDSQHVYQAIGEYLRQKNITWYENTFVNDILPNKIITHDKHHLFDMVFDCRGLGAKSVFPDLRGIRGELIRLYAPNVNIKHAIRFLHPRYNIYITPRKNNIYLIGASEIESEDYAEISVRTTLELLTAAYYIHPGFAEAKILQTITHCRPTLANHLPKIKYSKGLIAINGLYRHGYLIAPALVQEILSWLNQDVSEHS